MSREGRALTAGERKLAGSIFGRAIDYDRVRVHNRSWWWLQPRRYTMAPDGHLWFHPKSTLYCNDFCEKPLSAQGLFVHEMTHVWQHQRGVFLPLARHPFCRYSYSIKPGWPLERYGLEQQAEIVRHAFLAREGAGVHGGPDRAVYESILPFKTA